MKKTDMNLYERYRLEQKVVASRTSPVRLYLAIIIVAMLLMGAYSVKLLLDNTGVKNKINDINNYLNDSSIKSKIDELNDIQKKLISLNDIDTRIKEIQNVFAYLPRYDSEVLAILYYEKPTDLAYTKITYEQNVVSVEFSTKNPAAASNYALKLQQTNSFADVSYEGYKYDTEYGVYRGEILVMLRGGN